MSIVTLATDIETKDFLVGAIKGQILAKNVNSQVVDITHSLPSKNFIQSSYICYNAYKYYPINTIHVLLINLFESNPDHFLVVKTKKSFIICPDNGIITMLYDQKPEDIVSVPIELEAEETITTLAFTERIAETIRKLNEKYRLDEIGQKPNSIVEKYRLKATFGNDWLEAQILFVDHFENIVINITKAEFEEQCQNRNFRIELGSGERITSIKDNYFSVATSDKVAWFNSAGYLELSINQGNLAGLFGYQGENEGSAMSNSISLSHFYRSVKVFFEDKPETEKQISNISVSENLESNRG